MTHQQLRFFAGKIEARTIGGVFDGDRRLDPEGGSETIEKIDNRTGRIVRHASLPEIGRSFGGKHHSTVIHSIRKVEDLRKKDADFNSQIGNFLEGFK